MNRRLVVLVVIVAVIIAGLLGFYLYLSGGSAAEQKNAAPPAEIGVVHVRSIYAAGGLNMSRPTGVGADNRGGFFVTLRDDQKVVEFDSDGDFVRAWGERGLKPGQMMVPLGVAVDRLANHVYVTDRSRLRLMCFDQRGRYLWEVPVINALASAVGREGPLASTFGPIALFDSEGQLVREIGSRGSTPGQFDFARAVVPLEDGDLIVADTNNARVQRVSPSGDVTATVKWVNGEPPRHQDDPETAFGVPSGAAVDDNGRAFVLDGFRHAIAVVDVNTGKTLHTFKDLEGQADGRFYLPTGIAHLGGDRFAITDTYNDRVQIVRLLLPEDNTFVNRNLWVRWLPLLLLLPLLSLFGRRRAFATGETLELAAERANARLLAAVYRRLYVLPDVYERFADVEEAGIRLGDYLVALRDQPNEADSETTLANATRPAGAARLLLPRHIVVAANEDQSARLARLGVKQVETLEAVIESYDLKGDVKAETSG